MSEVEVGLVGEIKQLVCGARERVERQVNSVMLGVYWQIGRTIVEHEQRGSAKATYGRTLLRALSKALSRDLGRGFSVSNLQFMRRVFLEYPIQQTLSVKLSWSHYCELLEVSDTDARSFYEKECVKSNWSVRELRRQVDSSMFQRLLLTQGKANKAKVLELAQEGVTYRQPFDFIKDPYVFEFLGLPDNKPLLERDLERALIERIEHFLLELGRGFMYVGSQQRITLANTHYYVDMVFYNKILKAYVLIDLKMGGLRPEHVGQMNMYVNYYAGEVNDEGDEKPIGIILCADSSHVMAEFALGGLENRIFASKYVHYMPNKEQLVQQVQETIREHEQQRIANSGSLVTS